MRALIVDDSRFVRDFLRGLLEEKGIECEEAADGQAGAGPAAQRARLRPCAGGLEYAGDERAGDAQKMRAEGFTDIKVMMVTTEAENDFIIRALDAGADEYLMKPFDDEALNEKLAMLGLVEA